MRIATETLIRKYQTSVYAAAFGVCRNAMDAEDIAQDTFMAYHTSSKEFVDEEHAKAWLLRVAINRSIDLTRSFWRRNKVSIDDYAETLAFETPEAQTLFLEVLKLPQKYRIVLHLYYYEDMSARQIADVLRISESNVGVRLTRARKMLKDKLGEDVCNGF